MANIPFQITKTARGFETTLTMTPYVRMVEAVVQSFLLEVKSQPGTSFRASDVSVDVLNLLLAAGWHPPAVTYAPSHVIPLDDDDDELPPITPSMPPVPQPTLVSAPPIMPILHHDTTEPAIRRQDPFERGGTRMYGAPLVDDDDDPIGAQDHLEITAPSVPRAKAARE